MIGLATAALLMVSALPTGARSQAPSPLASVEPLLGEWQGTSEGQPGTGTVEREYSRMLRSRFIEERNRTVYPPQEKNLKGETHEHYSVFSFDNSRKRVIFRQFHVEGFVNQYVLEPSARPASLVFVTEAIENIPAGFRGRETYTFIAPDEVEEVFEIAEPGKEFEVYSRARLKRVAR